ncbi:IS5 family transposase [Xanthomonas sp. SS]|nr:IS5 family transposase [Xanthomonas sp. SI]QNH18848.1 IS5 family transposase [Xanthomonas sp. SS]
MTERGAQRKYALRAMFNALRWMARAGAPRRLLPNDGTPWNAVYQQPPALAARDYQHLPETWLACIVTDLLSLKLAQPCAQALEFLLPRVAA